MIKRQKHSLGSSSDQATDYLILGAGMAGLSTAFHLVKRNREKGASENVSVRVVDKIEQLGSPLQASSVNCGIVCHGAQAPANALSRFLFNESLAYARSFGDACKFQDGGCLELCLTQEEVDHMAHVVQEQHATGYGEKEIRMLQGDELRKVEPNIGPEVLAAV